MHTAIVVAAALALGGAARAGLAQPDAAGHEEELLALERALAETLATKSRADMERLLAGDFVLRASPDITRETWMSEAVSRCWGDRFDIDEFSARVEGAAAVTSFLLTFYVDPETCQPAVLRSLVTDVWARDGDSWRLRVRHSSPPPTSSVASQFGAVPETPPRWLLDAELSLVATGGNTSTRSLGVASELRHQRNRSTRQVTFTYVSSEADDVTQARAMTLQARQAWRVGEGVEVFARLGYARDRFAGIEHRGTLDAGLAAALYDTPRQQISVEAASGGTAENRIATARLRFGSASGAVRYLWRVAPGSELRNDFNAIADLTTARNWRFTNAVAVSLALTRLLSLKVSSGVEYRNLPVPGFRRVDVRTAAAVVLTLRGR